MHELTGIGKNPFPVRKGRATEPPTPTPGENQLPVAWGRAVDEPTNRFLIGRAAQLVFDQETVSTSS